MPPRACPTPERPPVDKLHDQSGAMLFQPLLQPRKALGVERTFALVVAHVAVGDRCAGLERLMGRLDLLADGDRNRGIVGLGRQTPVIATQMMQGVVMAGTGTLGRGQTSKKTVSSSPCRRMSKR